MSICQSLQNRTVSGTLARSKISLTAQRPALTCVGWNSPENTQAEGALLSILRDKMESGYHLIWPDRGSVPNSLGVPTAYALPSRRIASYTCT